MKIFKNKLKADAINLIFLKKKNEEEEEEEEEEKRERERDEWRYDGVLQIPSIDLFLLEFSVRSDVDWPTRKTFLFFPGAISPLIKIG